jgi:TolA-binding protein
MKEKVSFKDSVLLLIDNFFRKRAMLIWIALGIVLVFVIVIFVWVEIEKSTSERSTKQIENAEKIFSEWILENDEDKKTRKEEELLQRLSSIIKEYPNRYATQKALFLRAHFFSEKKDWDKAARDYLDCAGSFPKAYYVADCLYNAGVCFENKGDVDTALQTYTDCVKKYPESHIIPRVLFSMGRIYESKGMYKEADELYTKLETDHSLSNWSKLAQNRKIYLNTMGQN